jgi:uncharacterized SAM-binding protein YcdF (DUF218 family)
MKKSARHLLLYCILLLAAWSLAAWAAARALIVRAELPRADCIAVLSGASVYKERVRYAARLFKEGRAPKIILTNDGIESGWSTVEQRNPLFVERERDELKLAGVPPDDIVILPGQVTSTFDEAEALRAFAAAHHVRSMLVVTSAYHSRRALRTLRGVFAGSNVEIGLDAPPLGEESPVPLTWWLKPAGWRMVAGEYLKMLYYLLRAR